ncbi:MAG: adenylate/guanylate cyclase domain-containing protein [Pseudomonadota bacterium]|nr:adenylate/guanylate cyclase domain-containing protein [Pseudomonadota bacterium]
MPMYTAARCATLIQRALAQRAQENRQIPLRVRIGAAAGEPVENHLDLFGSTVHLAARLCSHAQPEQSVVSNVVAELCIGKGLTFQDLGEVSLRGFDRPDQNPCCPIASFASRVADRAVDRPRCTERRSPGETLLFQSEIGSDTFVVLD